ncbi:MAG: hypothetical protein V3T43_01535 [Nitrosomonadaceae bacterium]
MKLRLGKAELARSLGGNQKSTVGGRLRVMLDAIPNGLHRVH